MDCRLSGYGGGSHPDMDEVGCAKGGVSDRSGLSDYVWSDGHRMDRSFLTDGEWTRGTDFFVGRVLGFTKA